jgi:hypothetical protein
MRPPLFAKFVEKGEAALISAVEVYNKPGFRYREETFALLAINAWELLLKAQLLKGAANDPKVIRVYESRRTKAGKASKKQYLKRNRAGNPLTLSLAACVLALDKAPEVRLSPQIKANLDALIAIRDSAAHYINASPLLAKQVLEIASATVKNFVVLAKSWFDRDLSEYLSLVLPLSFIDGVKDIESVVVTAGEDRLIKYLQGLASIEQDRDSPYAVAIRVQVKLERSKLATALKVQVTNDPDAVKVVISEQDVKERYPWDYKALAERCAARYGDFKRDSKFHGLRKPLVNDARYAHSRFLDPGNPKSGRKDFYSPAILDVFDKHYAQKTAVKSEGGGA